MRAGQNYLFLGLMLTLGAVFFYLGTWQNQRAGEKQLMLDKFADAVEFKGLPAPGNAPEFSRLVVEGRFLQDRDTLADNQLANGRPGVHVYSAFVTTSGENLLVNRGWLPLSIDRTVLPQVPGSQEQLQIRGHLAPIPEPGMKIGKEGEMDQQVWPQLVTYPDLGKIASALDMALYPSVLFLSDSSPGGFEGRNWKPVYMPPKKHNAYAFQWFALSFASISGGAALFFRRWKSS